MVDQAIHDKLQHLHTLLLKEREYAKALAIDKMLSIAKEKERLLRDIGTIRELSPEDHSFAETIRAENRRNAYLFWSTLNWIRDSMKFFGQQVAINGYNPAGNTISNSYGGRLLSGKV